MIDHRTVIDDPRSAELLTHDMIKGPCVVAESNNLADRLNTSRRMNWSKYCNSQSYALSTLLAREPVKLQVLRPWILPLYCRFFFQLLLRRLVLSENVNLNI